MANLEVIARIKIRPGQLEGFKAQAAEIIRRAQERDTQTLRYDWFIDEEALECEVHEVYPSSEALLEHNMHILDERATLFRDFAYDHKMAAYGEVSQQLVDVATKHAGGIKVFSFLQGFSQPAAV